MYVAEFDDVLLARVQLSDVVSLCGKDRENENSLQYKDEQTTDAVKKET
jgi:hypothetical protein